MAQFIKNGHRLTKTPQLKEEYDAVIQDYLDLGHMKLVPSTLQCSQCFYLPHHAIIKPESTTTKV